MNNYNSNNKLLASYTQLRGKVRSFCEQTLVALAIMVCCVSKARADQETKWKTSMTEPISKSWSARE